MRFLSVLPALALVAASASTLAAQTTDPAMLKADQTFNQAIAKADKAALEQLLDQNAFWTTANGRTYSRSELRSAKALPDVIWSESKKELGEATTKPYTYGDLGNVQVDAGRAHILHVWAKRGNDWKLMVYQEVLARATPPTVTPGAGKECENPCKSLDFTPKTDIERQVALAYMKLETAAHARNSAGFAPMVADEFVAASSNSDRLQTKQSRIQQFDSGKDAGVAPTPLLSAKMFPFSQAVLMISEHKPVQGNPLHVTRFWIKRNSGWVSTMSYQTAVTPQ